MSTEVAPYLREVLAEMRKRTEARMGIKHRDGIDWHDAKPTLSQMFACLRGRHRWQTRQLGETERCICGAFGPAPWTHLDSGWRTYLLRKWREGRA